MDDLLAGSSGSSDEGPTAPRLERQNTAVADSPPRLNGGEHNIPEPVAEEEEPQGSQHVNGQTSNNLNPFMTNGETLGRPIPTSAVDPFLAGTLSEAQTPMNDTFLSTLAPSVHQRLDLARQMDEIGRATTPVREEAEAGRDNRSDDEWMEVDRQSSVAPEDGQNRRDVDMMFT